MLFINLLKRISLFDKTQNHSFSNYPHPVNKEFSIFNVWLKFMDIGIMNGGVLGAIYSIKSPTAPNNIIDRIIMFPVSTCVGMFVGAIVAGSVPILILTYIYQKLNTDSSVSSKNAVSGQGNERSVT